MPACVLLDALAAQAQERVFTAWLRTTVERGIRPVTFRPVRVEILVNQLQGMLQSSYCWSLLHPELTAETLAESVTDIFFHGVLSS